MRDNGDNSKFRSIAPIPKCGKCEGSIERQRIFSDARKTPTVRSQTSSWRRTANYTSYLGSVWPEVREGVRERAW